MTSADDLLGAIAAADPALCTRLLADLDESARRALHPVVAHRIEELDAELRDFSSPSRKERFDSYAVARLASLGVATLGELKKQRPWTFRRGEKTVAVVLANRRPAWLADWAEFEMARNFRSWPAVRALVRDGLIPRPATEFYILGMIAAPDRVPATVSFAMKALVECDRSGGLAGANVLDRLAPAFEARDKGTVERALALGARRAQEGDAPTKARVAVLAARALGHESPEVQTAALKLAGGEAALVVPYLAVLAPSVRAQLGTAEPAATPAKTPEVVEACGTAWDVEPVASLNELVETFAAVLENQGPPVDIERVIDGVARIGIAAAAHDAGFERLTAGLAKRVEKLLARGGTPQPRAALASLALAWTRGQRTAPPKSEENLADFLIWRLWSLSEQAAHRIEHPLLSLPSSADGRIDTTEFDRRLALLTGSQRSAAEKDTQSLFHLDFLLARLRAVGGASPVRTRLVWKKRSWEASGKTYSHYQTVLETEGFPKPGRFDPAALTMAGFWSTLEMKRWCATVSPHWYEGWFAAGCRELGSNLEWWQANWSTRAYLEPLLDPHTPIGPMGALLIALGLGAKETGESGLAADALIAATAGPRLDAAALGHALIEASASGAIKFARWARQLHRAAQAGSMQPGKIFLAIEALMESGHGVESGDFGRLVELEYQLAHLTGLRLNSPGAIRTLAALKTGGKTASAAGKLCKLSNAPGN